MDAPLCLLTRPLEQSNAFAETLGGIRVLVSPILRIAPLLFDRAAVYRAPRVIFTSANAVPLAGPGTGRQALCVGPQTADAARQAGFEVHIGTGDAEGVLNILQSGTLGPPANWLHLHGRHRVKKLPVPGIALYDQIAVRLSDAAQAALSQSGPVILPLFSPRTARLLSAEVGSATAPVVSIAISARADAAYRGPTVRRIVVASPDGDAMRDAILTMHNAERFGLPWVETATDAR